MGVDLDQGREGLGTAGVGVQFVAKAAAVGAEPVGDGAWTVRRWAVNGAAFGSETAYDGVVRGTTGGDRSRCQWHVDRHTSNTASRQRAAGLQQIRQLRFAASGPGLWIPVHSSGQIQKIGITGGKGPALPTGCGGLHQSDVARLMGGPGGIDAQHASCGWLINRPINRSAQIRCSDQLFSVGSTVSTSTITSLA